MMSDKFKILHRLGNDVAAIQDLAWTWKWCHGNPRSCVNLEMMSSKSKILHGLGNDVTEIQDLA